MAYPPAPFRFENVEQVLSLPAIPYSEKRRLPHAPGVYFVLNDDDQIIYIGSAYDSIKRRWLAHAQTKAARTVGVIRIAYMVCEDNSLRDVAEKFAIYMLQPALNVVSKRKWMPYFDKH